MKLLAIFSAALVLQGSTITKSSDRRAYWFQGVNQAGVAGWNLNYLALTNYTYSTLDATHIRPGLIVTANTTGSALWTVTPVTSTIPSIQLLVEVRSTDQVNSGSMALAYACVAAGTSVDNPSQTALTAITLATIDANKEVFTSTQAITCSGTANSPADLYVWLTPTAPSGGTLTLLRFGLVY
jgi:hypothetical protein